MLFCFILILSTTSLSIMQPPLCEVCGLPEMYTETLKKFAYTQLIGENTGVADGRIIGHNFSEEQYGSRA